MRDELMDFHFLKILTFEKDLPCSIHSAELYCNVIALDARKWQIYELQLLFQLLSEFKMNLQLLL